MVYIVVISVAYVSHEFLALVRTATSELPYVREKAPFDIADPAHISQFDGMLGPWDSRLPVTKLFPGIQDILGDQPPQVLSMMKELIPKIVRQLNLVAKPGTRLDLLYKTYGFCFQSRGQQDAGVVGLALRILALHMFVCELVINPFSHVVRIRHLGQQV